MRTHKYLSNIFPYLVVLFVCGQTGIHISPTQQVKMVSQIIVNTTIHLLIREIEESVFICTNSFTTVFSTSGLIPYAWSDV